MFILVFCIVYESGEYLEVSFTALVSTIVDSLNGFYLSVEEFELVVTKDNICRIIVVLNLKSEESINVLEIELEGAITEFYITSRAQFDSDSWDDFVLLTTVTLLGLESLCAVTANIDQKFTTIEDSILEIVNDEYFILTRTKFNILKSNSIGNFNRTNRRA